MEQTITISGLSENQIFALEDRGYIARGDTVFVSITEQLPEHFAEIASVLVKNEYDL